MISAKKILFQILLLSSVFPTSVFAYTSPGKPTGFVSDFAGALSTIDRDYIDQRLETFYADTGNQISVVIISSLGGDTIENYAVKLFSEWGIGQKGKDNGLLLLIAKGDRKMRIEVGYGLEGVVPDAMAFSIVNNILSPAFKTGDFAGGINSAVDALEANIIQDPSYVMPVSMGSGSSSFHINFELLFFIGFIVFQWLAAILGRSKSWWGGGLVGLVVGIIVYFVFTLFWGLIAAVVLIPLGLLFDFIVSRGYSNSVARGVVVPWYFGGKGGGRRGFSGGGFGGFSGGSSGGGGSSGSW